MPADKDKLNDLENFLSDEFETTKSGVIFSPGDIRLASHVPYGIPSGIPELDLAIGKPGLPVGKVIEFYGFEACGKTTAAYHAIGQCQKMGGTALFIDTEQSFDAYRAANVGVNVEENLLVSEVTTIEGIFRQIEATLKGLTEVGWNRPFIIVVDSVTAVPTEYEAQSDLSGEQKIGQEAKSIRRGMRRVWSQLGKLNVPAIFINHAVAKINKTGFGKTSQSAGGHALKFAASLRVEFTHVKNINASSGGGEDDAKEKIGSTIGVLIEKLKGASLKRPRFQVDLLNDGGFDRISSLLNALIRVGAVTHQKRSQHYTTSDGTNFTKDGWRSLCQQPGGFDDQYTKFIEVAQEMKEMQPWGSTNV